MNVHCIQDACCSGERGADGKGQRNHGIAVDPHERGGIAILRERAEGQAETGPLDGFP